MQSKLRRIFFRHFMVVATCVCVFATAIGVLPSLALGLFSPQSQQCDIVVQGTPSVSPNPVTAGNNITVSYVIHNNGPGSAGLSQTKIQIKNSSGTLITAPTFSAPSISAGANTSTQSNSVSIPAGTASGTYTAYVVLDNLSQLNQSNTNNDLTPGVNFTVSAPPQQCDIVVQGTPSISPNPVTAGNNITVNYVIHNNGPGSAGLSQTKIQIKNSSGTLITAPTFSAPSISAGANTSTQSNSVSIPAGTAAGTYTAYVVLDNLSQLNQSNTNNDLTPGVNFTVSAPPQQCDIVVQGTPSISPNPVTAGNSITVNYVIHNNGPGSAGSSQTKIQIKNSSGVQITALTFSAPAVSAGANTSTQLNSVSIPAGTASGTYTAYVVLDNLSQLNQSNTNNDLTAGVNFTVGSAPTQQLPNLIPQNITLSQNSVREGDSLIINWTLSNIGVGSAPDTVTGVRLNQSATSHTGFTIANIQISSLPANSSSAQTATILIPQGTAPGTYYIWIIADNVTNSSLQQQDYSDDFQHSPAFTVTGLPNGNGPIKGVDVSRANDVVDWGSMASSGIRFAYIKATESNYSPDSKFLENINAISGAPGHQIAVGAYHFATPLFSPGFYQSDYDHQGTAIEEAQHFSDTASVVIGPGFLPPALDVEEQVVKWRQVSPNAFVPDIWVDPLTGKSHDSAKPPNRLPDRPAMGAQALAQWIKDWVTKVRDLTHVTPIIYCDRSHANALAPFLSSFDNGSLKLWIADPSHPAGSPDTPSGWQWIFHQYSTTGAIGGQSIVDLDSFIGDSSAFNALLLGNSSAPPPVSVATLAGQSVTIQGNGATVTFANVQNEGVTTVSLVDPASVGQLPSGYQSPSANNSFDIATTANIQPPITTCFSVPSATDVGTFSLLRVLHNENGILVDRTTSKDFALKTICGNVNSLSPFTVAFNRTNPLAESAFFVRQHYVDFLSREPDSSGLNFWTNEITSCGTDQSCIELKRINVSAAYFLSIEFQQTGYLVERMYKAAYGDAAGVSSFGGTHQLSVPIVRFDEFLADSRAIGEGVIVGQPGSEQLLENNKQAFAAAFVAQSRFTTAFPLSLTAAQFVDSLNANAGNPLSTAERNQLVNDLTNGARNRAQVVRAVAEDSDLNRAESNRAFVLMQYFGYLRRNPNEGSDSDYTGYDFWLRKLNQFNGNFVNAEMVKAFIVSGEYRQRFGPE